MGNALNTFFCTACDPKKIDITNKCIENLEEDEDFEKKSCELRKAEKLRCSDESHTKQQELTVEYVTSLINDIETRLKKKQVDWPCPHHQAIIGCLEDNPDAMLNCKVEMDEFIDCVDAIRVTTIKKQIEEDKALKKSKKL